MIKNIVFDLGNVILKGKSSTCISNICENKEEQEILKAFFNSNTQELDLGYITIKDYYEQCNIQKNIKEKYKNKLIEYYKYRSYNEDILELINILKENYNIYILSNNNNEVYEYLKTNKKFKNIDGWIISSTYHCVKPDEKIYKILFKEYNIKPEESIFIDDKKENIETSKKLGMDGYVLDYENDGIEKLIQFLKEKNITGEFYG